ILLVLVGGLLAGLTLGLMSLNQMDLLIMEKSGTPREQAWAKHIRPIRANGHLLLVTLLLANTLVNETLPIIMDSIFGGGITAILGSTALIFIFGEIIPQSICSKHGLRIGAFFAWPVRILTWLLWVVAYPIARLLDWILGRHDGALYRRAELSELVNLHAESAKGPLNPDEVMIIRGALNLHEKRAVDVMTRMQYVFSIDRSSRLDRSLVTRIVRAGHSRIPVHEGGEKERIIGVMLVKSLILLDPDDGVPVDEVKINSIPRVSSSAPLLDLLNRFQEGNSHMAIVVDEEEGEKGKPLGIITLEDVIEELIQEEIVDETDVYVDVSQRL
ncbi:hypothetical protein BJ684DRAFT_1180, partial [Piptocephalis cylindrospora]